MYKFSALIVFLLLGGCAIKQSIKLPKSYIRPSPHFLTEEYYQGSGANFFNDEEEFDRLLAAKRMGVRWIRLTPSKWRSALSSEPGTFLVGNKDHYSGLIKEDLAKLLTVLDWAEALDLKVVLTFLSVPGRIFAQHNGGAQDTRIWSSFEKQDEAIQFFGDVALYIGHHPALLALNPINEPAPEIKNPDYSNWLTGDYSAWYANVKGTPQDLNQFYAKAVQKIRKFRSQLPIMLDAGLYAHPWAFKILDPIKDPYIYYAFHWYLPFVYTEKEVGYSYPGTAPAFEHSDNRYWDKNTLAQFLEPVLTWAKKHAVDKGRIVAGEFGVNRLLPGAREYLGDARDLFKANGFLHAFYSFREPHFPRMDYELGTREMIPPYWQAIEAKVTPPYAELTEDEFLPVLGLRRQMIKKPLKGFSTWNYFGSTIDHHLVVATMDAMTNNGLLKAGYDTIIIDGGWRSEQLSKEHQLRPDPKKFPFGIKKLANIAHAQGFKLGLHIPVGSADCRNRSEGTLGYEKANAELIRDWGIDVVKLDRCLLDGSEDWDREIQKATFSQWHIELQRTKIQIMANASRFYSWYPRVANYGRTALDLRPKIFGGAQFNTPYVGEFLNVVEVARENSRWVHENSDVYLNDPDMLVIGNNLTPNEEKSHFAMWVMMSAPLLLGNDPRSMSEEALSLVTNEHLLAIHQDQYETGQLIIDDKNLLVFRKRLKDGATAFLFVSLQNEGKMQRSFSYQELNVIKPSSISSAFAKKNQNVQKRLMVNLAPHDCELLVLK